MPGRPRGSAVRVFVAAAAATLVVLLAQRMRAPASFAPAQAERVALAAPPAPTRDNVSESVRHELERLEARVQRDTADAASLLRLASLERDAHEPSAAARYYRRYLALRPAEREVALDLAAVLAQLGEWQEARTLMERLLERNPLDVSAWYNLGAIAANQRDTASARRWWRKVERQSTDTALAAAARTSLQRLEDRRP